MPKDESELYAKYIEVQKQLDDVKDAVARQGIKVDDVLKPRPPKIISTWFEKRDIQKQPDKIMVRLTGMTESQSYTFGHGHQLNNHYDAQSPYTEFEVTDQNDMAFFIRKAIKNNELYEILEPEGLIDKHLAAAKKEADEIKAKRATVKKKFADRFKKKKK